MSNRIHGAAVLAAVGIIGLAVTCVLLFYGTVAAVAYHFIHKFW